MNETALLHLSLTICARLLRKMKGNEQGKKDLGVQNILHKREKRKSVLRTGSLIAKTSN